MKANGIGVVFTPENWALWLIERYNILEKWLSGASVLDPTCGEGAFFHALVQAALNKGVSPSSLPINKLFGIERESEFLLKFRKEFKKRFNVEFPKKNLHNADILLEDVKVKCDIIVGNPPWLNFCDLPGEYKLKIKKCFIEYNLVDDGKDLLLGSSRIDIAALVISKAIYENLNADGSAYLFLPLSLFLNQGAHRGFRRFEVKDINYSLEELFDFEGVKIFEGVETRYGTAAFRRNKRQSYPIDCHRMINDSWVKFSAAPLFDDKNAISIFSTSEEMSTVNNFTKFSIEEVSKPRQGINTCGANDALIFKKYKELSNGMVEVESVITGKTILPKEYVYPLITKKNFTEKNPQPESYILFPYRKDGKPLSEAEIGKYPEMWNYLLKIKDILTARKGVLIGSWIERGYWWAMLGAGPYCFAPYKVAWLAYGNKVFEPVIFNSHEGIEWQGNQAMHAFIPAYSLKQAKEILSFLKEPEVMMYLNAFRMNGTRSWAQPGKISKLFTFI